MSLTHEAPPAPPPIRSLSEVIEEGRARLRAAQERREADQAAEALEEQRARHRALASLCIDVGIAGPADGEVEIDLPDGCRMGTHEGRCYIYRPCAECGSGVSLTHLRGFWLSNGRGYAWRVDEVVDAIAAAVDRDPQYIRCETCFNRKHSSPRSQPSAEERLVTALIDVLQSRGYLTGGPEE